MTDDLVKRLRIGLHKSVNEQTLRDEAANRIEQLEAALKEIISQPYDNALRPNNYIARAALAGEKKE